MITARINNYQHKASGSIVLPTLFQVTGEKICGMYNTILDNHQKAKNKGYNDEGTIEIVLNHSDSVKRERLVQLFKASKQLADKLRKTKGYEKWKPIDERHYIILCQIQLIKSSIKQS